MRLPRFLDGMRIRIVMGMIVALVLSFILKDTFFLSSSPAINVYYITSIPSRITGSIVSTSGAITLGISGFFTMSPIFSSTQPSYNTEPTHTGNQQPTSGYLNPTQGYNPSVPTPTFPPNVPTPTYPPNIPTPTSKPGNNPTATPTQSPQGSNKTPFVLGKGNKSPAVFVSGSTAYFSWWDPNLLAVWYTSCTGTNTCQANERVSPASLQSYYSSVTMSQGIPVVVWEAKDPSTTYALYVSRKTSGWSSPQKISAETYAETPNIASDGSGTIHLIYQGKTGGSSGTIYYRSSNDGGVTWSSAEKVASGLLPRIALGSDGSLYAVWFDTPSYSVFFSKKTAGGWSNPITVASGTKDQTPDVSVDSSGNAHVVYSENNGNYIISYKKLSSNGTVLESQTNLGKGLTYSMWPKIAVDSGGNAKVVFQGKTGNIWGIYEVDKNGSWENPQLISMKSVNQENPDIDSNSSLRAIIYSDHTSDLAVIY